MSGFTEIGRATLWRGDFLSVEDVTLRGPSGQEFWRRVVRHPGAVGIVAVDDGRVLLVDHYRASIARSVLEIPAGKRDVPGEEPLACAQRELREEVGLRAERWEHLITFAMTPGWCDEWFHLYMAEQLSAEEADPQGEEEATMTQAWVDLSEVPAMIDDGRIADGKTIIGLLLALQRRA